MTQELQTQPMLLILIATALGHSSLAPNSSQIHAIRDLSEINVGYSCRTMNLHFKITVQVRERLKLSSSVTSTLESDIPEQNVEVMRVSLAHFYLPFQKSSPYFPWRLRSLCFSWTESRSADVSLHRPSRRSSTWWLKMWTLRQNSWVQILALPLVSCVPLRK